MMRSLKFLKCGCSRNTTKVAYSTDIHDFAVGCVIPQSAPRAE